MTLTQDQAYELFAANSPSKTELEVKNKNVEVGDYIIHNNPNNLMEKYSVKPAKFLKLYHPEPIGVDENGLNLYEAKDTVVRKCVIVTSAVVDYMVDIGVNFGGLSQQELLNLCKGLTKTPCKKKGVVSAFRSTKSGELETHVLKSDNPLIFEFQQPLHWGEGTMPLKLNDALIVADDEVYRIAEQEFRRTYEIL